VGSGAIAITFCWRAKLLPPGSFLGTFIQMARSNDQRGVFGAAEIKTRA
jgi:hypothetical protein